MAMCAHNREKQPNTFQQQTCMATYYDVLDHILNDDDDEKKSSDVM